MGDMHHDHRIPRSDVVSSGTVAERMVIRTIDNPNSAVAPRRPCRVSTSRVTASASYHTRAPSCDSRPMLESVRLSRQVHRGQTDHSCSQAPHSSEFCSASTNKVSLHEDSSRKAPKTVSKNISDCTKSMLSRSDSGPPSFFNTIDKQRCASDNVMRLCLEDTLPTTSSFDSDSSNSDETSTSYHPPYTSNRHEYKRSPGCPIVATSVEFTNILRSSSEGTALRKAPKGRKNAADVEKKVRLRRRDGGGDTVQSTSASRSLNRSFPCVYEASQFSTVRSNSFIHEVPESDVSKSCRSRTAVVGPSKAVAAGDSPYIRGDLSSTGMCRSQYENSTTPTANRYESVYNKRRATDGNMGNCISRRRSLQNFDNERAGLYELSRPTTQYDPRCAFNTSGDPTIMPTSPIARPRDIRVVSSSPTVCNDGSSPAGQSNQSGSRRTSNNGIAAQMKSQSTESPVMTSTPVSKKMMVAPQPHYRSHNKNRTEEPVNRHISHESSCQRRQSTGAVIPSYSFPNGDLRSAFPRETCPETSYDPFYYPDARLSNGRSCGDIRVAVLEQRVRELEAAFIGGQTTSASTSAPSFIIPVVQTKSNRILPLNPTGQFVVSTGTSNATQQLMAQEIADKEVEIERLHAQLRKCYSRMEVRQVQYDEEVSAFRKDSEDAKAQLTGVKGRLSELEAECQAYREKAASVESARVSAVAQSHEKIAQQEREIHSLKAKLEESSQQKMEVDSLRREISRLRKENNTLHSTVAERESKIHDLEDSIFTMRVEGSSAIESGCVTPHGENYSLFDIDVPKLPDEVIDFKETFVSNRGISLHNLPIGVSKSRSTQQISPSTSGQPTIMSYLPSSLSQYIRRQHSMTMECRLLAKCLRDIAARAICGDIPSVNRLLGIRSDSMSESEQEALPIGSHPLSVAAAEKFLKKNTDDLSRIEKELNGLREKFVEYYQMKVANELRNDESCRIQ